MRIDWKAAAKMCWVLYVMAAVCAAVTLHISVPSVARAASDPQQDVVEAVKGLESYRAEKLADDAEKDYRDGVKEKMTELNDHIDSVDKVAQDSSGQIWWIKGIGTGGYIVLGVLGILGLLASSKAAKSGP